MALSAEEVIGQFGVDPKQGLSEKEAVRRVVENGKNVLDKGESGAWQILGRQFKSAFIYLLFAAAAITFLLKQYLDSSFILFFVVINVLLGFFQEYRSEKTARLLKKYTGSRATVLRDGQEKTAPASELTLGDVVIIETGDIVPADIRLLEVNSLLVDESTLTGESEQVRKQIEAVLEDEPGVFSAKNIAFSGTTVVEGKGIGIVVAIGKDTEIGKIAKLTTQVKEISSYEKKINKFSRFVLFLILITLAIVFVARLLFKDDVSAVDLMLFSIALAVGVVPEAMPLVTTFSLSAGASKLAKKAVIVKKLASIEELGSIQILCTDKTGTITENVLTVKDIYSQDNEETLRLGIIARSSLDSQGTPNNAFDIAILHKAEKSFHAWLAGINWLYEIPFNPRRRRNSVLVEKDGGREIIIRGAPEAILPHLKGQTQESIAGIMAWVSEQSRQGRRIITVAKRTFSGDKYGVEEEEKDVELVGLISFEDPIKDTAKEAVKKAKELGVVTKIVTGDAAEVAAAVGMEIGIASSFSDVITGDEFDALGTAEKLEAAKRVNVFARMTPEQKYELIRLLQETHEVGFLGEGINDAPALKAAGASIVVDHAADVAREAADIILLKHDLLVIIDGIELGRKTFVNVTNYVKATLISNFGNFYAMAFVTLMVDFLPMLPVQILLVNLLSDFPMISIATDTVDKRDTRSPKSFVLKEMILLATILGLVSTAFDFMMFGIFNNYGVSSLQTYWFIGSILTELVLIYSIRTRGWCFKVKNLPSKTIVILTLVAAILTVLIPYTGIGSSIFKFIVPSADKLLLILGIVFGYLVSTELVKKLYYRYFTYL